MRVLELVGAVALLATAACGDDVGTPQDTDTEGGDESGSDDSTGEAEEAGLQVAYLRGTNLLGTRVYLVDTCVGEGCPSPVTELREPDDPPPQAPDPVVICDAAAMLDGLPQGYACSLSAARPSIEFDMSTALRRDSFELTRPSSDAFAPDGLEGFWWNADVVRVVGPKTTYAGGYVATGAGPGSGEWDALEMVSVTCEEALAAEGLAYTADQLPDLCTSERRTVVDGVFGSASGILDRECGSGRSDPEDPALSCVCGDTDPTCAEVATRECVAPWGDAAPTYGGDEGAFAYGFLRRRGGPSFQAQSQLVRLRLDLLGTATPSSTSDGCVEAGDDWSRFSGTHEGPFDHAMCSDSVYRVEFATSEAPLHIQGEGGEVFDGGSVFEFRTAPFVVVPGSKFPSDDLTITQSEDISVRFSAVPDFSMANLGGVYITHGSDGPVVAGGPECDPTADEDTVEAGDAIPCLQFDPQNFQVGEISFRIEVEQYGRPLQVGERYFVHFPDESSDTPFIDVCGNALRSDAPTVLGWTIDSAG